ncbi:ABHD17B-like protein [Tanacetum coccineum]
MLYPGIVRILGLISRIGMVADGVSYGLLMALWDLSDISVWFVVYNPSFTYNCECIIVRSVIDEVTDKLADRIIVAQIDIGGACSRKQGQQVSEDGAFRGCSMQDIDLCECIGVDDSWMDVISSQGSSLLYAYLSGSYFTDCGLVHFKVCENIQALNFNYCDQISDNGLGRIRDQGKSTCLSGGSGPMLHLAARLQRLRGVVLHSAILSGIRVFYNVKMTLWFDIFENIDKIQKVSCPVLVIHVTIGIDFVSKMMYLEDRTVHL